MIRSLGAKTFVYPAPVFMVGTYDEYGRANLMAAANPPIPDPIMAIFHFTIAIYVF